MAVGPVGNPGGVGCDTLGEVDGLVSAFWTEESDPIVRRMILDEAAGKERGATHWDFNVFALTLDFDNEVAVVEDLLGSGEREEVGLPAFLRTAAAFGDPPTDGDGLTEAERHPPTYMAGPTGDVARVDE